MGSDLYRGAGKPKQPVKTLCGMFDQSVGDAPERVALRHLGITLSYRELGRAVSTLAQRLAEMVVPGEVVALLLPNSIEFQVAYFGALKALAAPALLNPLYPEVQLSPLLQAASARVVLCAPATHDMVAALARNLGIHVVCLGRDITVQDLVAEATKPTGLRASSPEHIGALLFSGGTTGLPKAVEHTHRRLVTAVRGMEHIWPTRTDGEVFLPVAPFTHVYGFLQGVLVPLSACGETVIPERFKPEHIVELFERHQVTFFGGGPPVQVVDLETGLCALPPGTKGELRVRGPHMMTHYRNQPEETAKTIRDGFIYTGDIGYLDEDGFVFITDRRKDVVFVKGFNVFPREVEELIHTHPKVDMVGVVGVPDPRNGSERLVAFVVPQMNETIHPDDISAYCAARLVGYQCPTEVRVVKQLPVTGAQKLDRVALRRAATEE